MGQAQRRIMVALPLIAALIGVYLLVISPKTAEVSTLDDQVSTLQGELTVAQGEVAAGEAARKSFSKNYGDLVALGAAAPEDDDQATLVYNISRLSTDHDLRFSAFTLSQTASVDPAAAAPPAAAPPAEGETAATPPATTTASTTTVAPATEASAATLPIGAAVGPAGLPIMSYDFNLTGTFFDTIDFLGQVDESVDVSGDEEPVVHGRLMTIDGFSLALEDVESYPEIQGNFAVTTYLVPAEQGVEAGATEAGPAPVGSPEAPTTVTAAPTSTATVTP